MRNDKMSVIFEELSSSRGTLVNEASKSGITFRKGYGVQLKKDLMNFTKRTLFYADDVNKDFVCLSTQKDRNNKVMLPMATAQEYFVEVGGFEIGKTYTLKIDFPYSQKEYTEDLDGFDKLAKKYSRTYKGEGWIYFPKGTKFKYEGSDKSGSEFTVDGVYVPVSEFSIDNRDYETYEVFNGLD